MKLAPHILIVGVDGSGKTTTAQAVIGELKKQGHKVYYEYNGRVKFTFLTFLNKSSKKLVKKKQSQGQSEHAIAYKSPLMRLAASIIYITEYAGRYLKLLKKRRKYDVIISDRGYLDVLVSPNTNLVVAKLGKLLLPKQPTIYVYNDIETIAKRRDDHPKEDLQRQLHIYDKFRLEYIARIKTDDEKQTKEKVVKIVKKIISS